MSKIWLVILGAVVLNGVSAEAMSMSIGPQLGFYKALDADQQSQMFGLTGRMKLNPVFGLEASINYRQEKYADDALTVKSWPVMFSGLVYPLPFVYGVIGAGWYNVTYDINQNKLPFLLDKTTQEYGWHFGAGLDLPINNNFNLMVDLRYVYLDYDFQDIPGSSDLESDFYVASVGFLFFL
ncbi:MAG: hypothetical protein COY19_07505 [Candidatus Marinimicrobia bacterium CG_4_10_14_0_2_um_filter_48_9]|nr:MAG: hypothetical protein COY19_07505 [Candidatus Marinimicrobia bacterium CG_4_10_14_0_2_um_filter_48_9]